jgi:hypothetical protein
MLSMQPELPLRKASPQEEELPFFTLHRNSMAFGKLTSIKILESKLSEKLAKFHVRLSALAPNSKDLKLLMVF